MDDPERYIIDGKTGRAHKDHFHGVNFDEWPLWKWAAFIILMGAYVIGVSLTVGFVVKFVMTAFYDFIGWH